MATEGFKRKLTAVFSADVLGYSRLMGEDEGKNATYHEPPDWLQTEKWFDIPKTW